MMPVVCGQPIATDSNNNRCSVASIASPDNVAFMEDFDTLLIAEDTSNHRNDMLWQARFVVPAPRAVTYPPLPLRHLPSTTAAG